MKVEESLIINTRPTRMHTINLFLIYSPLLEWKLSSIQPTLPFHSSEVLSSSSFTCLDFDKYIRIYVFMTMQYLFDSI